MKTTLFTLFAAAALLVAAPAAEARPTYQGKMTCDGTVAYKLMSALLKGKGYQTPAGYVAYKGTLKYKKYKGTTLQRSGTYRSARFAPPARTIHGWVFEKTAPDAAKILFHIKRYSGSSHLDVKVCGYTRSGSNFSRRVSDGFGVEAGRLEQSKRENKQNVYVMVLVSARSKLAYAGYSIKGIEYR